jgi:peptide methionine sulfoxide reductase msrA/msrB
MDFSAFPAATFAGGCFWCLEADVLHLPGVLSATSGYTGGHTPAPTYDEVCQGESGHFEAVLARFDPELVDYAALARWFLGRIDPANPGGQFCDHGPQYRTAFFVHDAQQDAAARAALDELNASGVLSAPAATQVLPAGPFHPAEAYHQGYSRTNPRRYQLYRAGCGRDATLARIWGREAASPFFRFASKLPRGGRPTPAQAEALRAELGEAAFRVAFEDGTEPPFQNAYWNEHRPGLYVDPVSGAPLFASLHKFDSGTGWPSFTRPIAPGNVTTRDDRTLLMPRTEVRAWHSGIHLGHVFDDGPRESGGRRYCMNSASLRFLPLEELAAAGYGRYARALFASAG